MPYSVSASANAEPLANAGASVGIFIVVVIVLIALGILAFWGNNRSRVNLDEEYDTRTYPENNEPSDEIPDATDENPDVI